MEDWKRKLALILHAFSKLTFSVMSSDYEVSISVQGIEKTREKDLQQGSQQKCYLLLKLIIKLLKLTISSDFEF